MLCKSFFADLNIAPEKLNKELWVFSSNGSANGGTSWWLECQPEPVLIDCPQINLENIEFLKSHSAGKNPLVILTSREGHGNIRELQDQLGWPVLIQEQEAYLLPELPGLKTFGIDHITVSGLRLLWTPGPTPGSCVVYAPKPRNVLFCGRLLIPLNSHDVGIFRHARTFHWTRQQKSFAQLLSWLPPKASPELALGVGLKAVSPNKLLPWDSLNVP